MFNEFTLVTARLQDIDTILELRNYNVYDPVKNRGKRNSFLFVHLAMWINANSYKLLFKNIKEEAYQFNKQFNIPLSEKQINPVVRHFWERYKEGTPNKMSTEYIVNVLEITPEEMQHTSNLIDKNEKNDRKKIANKVNRRNEKGLTPKQQELRELYSNIINFKNEGKSNKIISELLNIPLKTLERHITKLKKSNLL